jgi:hypothetical protein
LTPTGAYCHVNDNDYHFNPSVEGIFPGWLIFCAFNKHRRCSSRFQPVCLSFNLLKNNKLFKYKVVNHAQWKRCIENTYLYNRQQNHLVAATHLYPSWRSLEWRWQAIAAQSTRWRAIIVV